MHITRRDTLQLGLAGISGLGLSAMMPSIASAAGDSYQSSAGEIVISPVEHASFVMTVPELVVYNDPIGGGGKYSGMAPAGLVLVSHEHDDHFDPATLAAVVGADTKLVVNPSVMEKLPADLKAKATAIGNGQDTTVGAIKIEAIPAYNTTEDRKKYHPQGRDNGYVLTIGDRRVYIAGDTEDIPEMRALKDIHVAFVPMILPYTMDETQAGSAVAEFKPAFVYPYHYKGSDLDLFASKLPADGGTKVVLGKWYG